MEPLFQTKRISAVEAEAGDIPFIIRMENAAENRNFIWQGTKEQHLAEIADPEHILAVFRTADGNSIGYMLCHVDAKSDVFELRRIAIDIKGKGYGREAMEGTMRYAFEVIRASAGIWIRSCIPCSRANTLKGTRRYERSRGSDRKMRLLLRKLPFLCGTKMPGLPPCACPRGLLHVRLRGRAWVSLLR